MHLFFALSALKFLTSCDHLFFATKESSPFACFFSFNRDFRPIHILHSSSVPTSLCGCSPIVAAISDAVCGYAQCSVIDCMFWISWGVAEFGRVCNV
ncbi:hypothetical protein BJ912DRAFT_100278 [Pholiota molesta]|nr:hypothetical protein BJ912DRAFT_100278 [Pholiota molesta]